MSFASLIFFVFLPVVFCLHWLVPSKRWQNGVLLAASYVFYGWWDWRFGLLMLGSSLVDYVAGIWIDRAEGARRKALLIVALSLNLSLLGFFKYCNFFVESLISGFSAFGVNLPSWSVHVVLPVGISFYTFQTMSYTIDIYFDRFKPLRSVVDYLTFVSFFPQLVAGPIERATDLLPQFHAPRSFSLEEACEGCRFIAWGLAKKLLVADTLSVVVTRSYDLPKVATGASLFIGTLAFAFQIYGDFSGYSDIAVGTAKLFGVRLMRNFAYPYFSRSFTEFWRRWHISLSTWFRDYIYIPLGGSRVSRWKRCRNLLAVTLISGLWHGAAWHFVIWGLLHGVFLVSEQLLNRAPRIRASAALDETPGGERLLPSLPDVLRMLRTFSMVCFAWIFFRASSVPQAWSVILKIASGLLQPAFYSDLLQLTLENTTPLASLGAFVLIEWYNRQSWSAFNLGSKPVVIRWAAYTALFWYVFLFGTRQSAEFIYFQF